MIKFFKYNSSWLTVLLLSIIPVIRWFFLFPLHIRFFDIYEAATSLGQIAGLVGMVLFSLNLILSSRLKILDRYFFGLNNVYKYHSRIGSISFCLLLLHPLFLAISYLQVSLIHAFKFLLPIGSLVITYGIVALWLMIILMILTLYVRIKYHYWKLSHKFMVVVFIFAVLHTMMVSSDVSYDNFLRWYILGIAYIGLASGFYRAFLSRYWNTDLAYKVVAIRELNPQILEIELSPKNKKLNFISGQFIFVRFFSQNLSSESHPFSLVSIPTEKNIKIIVKSLGDFTSQMQNIKVGDYATIDGPFGRFSYKYLSSYRQIWLAGGIGITPFISMARSLPVQSYQIDLYYCTKNNQEAVLLNELLKISSINKSIRVISWCSDERGRISAEKTIVSENLAKTEVMLCGPDIFMRQLRSQFITLGLKSRQIHWEQFKF